ncbi:MAG: hypothetical protein AAF939_10245 [Planctomycetota bacterium]
MNYFTRFMLAIFSLALIHSTVVGGDTFTERADWQNAVCGTIVGDGFGELIDFTGQPFSSNPNFTVQFLPSQSTSWATITNTDGSLPGIFAGKELGVGSPVLVGVGGPENNPYGNLDFTLNPDLGDLEGFYFNHIFGAVVVTMYDGDTVVDSFTTDLGDDPSNFSNPTVGFGWTNTDSLKVTKIRMEFTSLGTDVSDIAIGFGEIAFDDGSCPSDDALDGILEVLDAVASIPPTGNRFEDFALAYATSAISEAANPDFFTEDGLLTNQGQQIFSLLNQATRGLNWVSDPAAQTAIDDIQQYLSDIVQAEIDSAVAAEGVPFLINVAESYLGLAEAYAAIGVPRTAIRLRSFSWFFARISY